LLLAGGQFGALKHGDSLAVLCVAGQ
jgi:hypothetical protein